MGANGTLLAKLSVLTSKDTTYFCIYLGRSYSENATIQGNSEQSLVSDENMKVEH